MTNAKQQKRYLFTLAFLEGGAVMACELLGAKMVTPFFGSSLYVWAAVLGVTLGALMSGYYLGGYVSNKYNKKNMINIALIVAGFLLVIMPYLSKAVMTATIDMSIQWGTTVSLLVFMFPPLLFMGMTSPMIINSINDSIDTTGKSAGSVYAISTLGGIISTFLLGFYLMPEFGIKTPALIYGAILVAAAAVALVMKKNIAALIVIVAVGACLGFVKPRENNNSARYQVRYESEGILGQLKVIDQNFSTYTRGQKKARMLFVNNTGQTILDVNDPDYSLWDWSYYFPTAASVLPENSDALLLGLGGGVLLKQFNRLNFNVDVVEIDHRIRDVAIEYFFVDPATNIVVDDARHYINTTTKKYDIVTLDLFLSETPPAHVLSLESFEATKKILKPGGMIMINFYGYVSGNKGKASRSLYKTLTEAGFSTKIFATPGEEQNRNLILLASLDEKRYNNLRYREKELPVLTDIEPYFIDPATLNMSDAVLLTDNKPELEKMYLEAAVEWRKTVNKYYTKNFLKDNLSAFK